MSTWGLGWLWNKVSGNSPPVDAVKEDCVAPPKEQEPPPPKKKLPVVIDPRPVDNMLTYGTAFRASNLNAVAKHGGAPVPGTYTYTSAGVTYTAGTLPPPTENMTMTVAFIPDDTETYETPVPVDIKYRVERAELEVVWNGPKTIMMGEQVMDEEVTATATFRGEPVTGSIRFNQPANDKESKKSLYKVSFTADTGLFKVSREQLHVQVVKEIRTVVITWDPPAPIVYGTPLSKTQLCAKGDPDDEVNFDYNYGLQKMLDEGEHTLRATVKAKRPADYKPDKVSVQVPLQVTPATPVITWAAPPEANPNAALGADQLNAKATFTDGLGRNVEVEGTFTYSTDTAAAAVGPQVITATFVPKNTKRYNAPPPKDVTLQVVWVTEQQKKDAGASDIEDKLLNGDVNDDGALIGAHSRSILNNADYRCKRCEAQLAHPGCAHNTVRPNGTIQVQVEKNVGGVWVQKVADSTLPPNGWTDDMFMKVTVDSANTMPADGDSTFQVQRPDGVGGFIQWRVIKRNGVVAASFPTGN